MKHIFLLFLSLWSYLLFAQSRPFKFAFISDTHINETNISADEDLRRTISDINKRDDIDFVVLTGDITELGTNKELAKAKQILDSLDIKYYIIPGNHDTGWSESGGQQFNTVFGNDKFSFEHKGIRFIGCASGPYVRMSDGHVPRSAVNWLDAELKALKKDQPVIFLNHYPIDSSLDNWYEITDRLRKKNTLAILCGHGHTNKVLDFEEIPGVMGLSNLRAKDSIGGYNIVEVTADSISFFVNRPGTSVNRKWHTISAANRKYNLSKKFKRPAYTINDVYASKVKAKWVYHAAANIISTPAVSGKKIVTANQDGDIIALDISSGKLIWKFHTQGAVFSSPATDGKNIIAGSADGNLYCLNETGQVKWKYPMGAAILGSPLIKADTVFIGTSGGDYAAIDLRTGKEIWKFDQLHGPVMSKPLWHEGKLIFGAWDTYLYALNSGNGTLIWKWNNGSAVRHYSPAACIPVASDGTVYIAAPDRFLSAIDANTGATLWRTKQGGLRESVGISDDGKLIFGKSMQDSVIAFQARKDEPVVIYRINAGFGYEHVPSMLIEKNKLVYFGTKNGVVFCVDPYAQEVIWKYKIDNSMVNTICIIDDHSLVAATMDGKVAVLKWP